MNEERQSIFDEQKRRLASDRALRLRAARSNWGRAFGWFVEHRGLRVAALSEAEWSEMFWDSYLITPLTDDASTKALLTTLEFWFGTDVLFANRELDLYAPFAFGAGDGPRNGRISMRYLYIQPCLTPLDHVLLFAGRLFSGTRNAKS